MHGGHGGRRAARGPAALVTGIGSGDVAVAGDYDGDGRADIAVFRPSNGVWYVDASGTGGDRTRAWGTDGDMPVPGDYDGNATTEIAVFRPSTGTWFVDGGPTIAWGTDGDMPVPGDYDGNATTEIAVFRPLPATRSGPTRRVASPTSTASMGASWTTWCSTTAGPTPPPATGSASSSARP